MGVQAHTAHVHFKVQEAQEAQVYLAIEPAAKWLEFSWESLKYPVLVEVESGMFVESGTNDGTGFWIVVQCFWWATTAKF